MELNVAKQINSWGQDQSFHLTFPAQSGTFQVTLAQRYDYNDWAVPLATSLATFFSYGTLGGGSHDLETNTATFSADNVSELKGLLMAENCFASAIVNAFTNVLVIKKGPWTQAATKVVAVYQSGTGKIVHLHSVAEWPGGRAVSEDEALEDALAHAARGGREVKSLMTKVSADPAHASNPHLIDVGTGQFVAAPLPSFRTRRFQD